MQSSKGNIFLSRMFAAAVYMCGSWSQSIRRRNSHPLIEFVGHWLSTLDCYLWADLAPCRNETKMVWKELKKKSAPQTSCARHFSPPRETTCSHKSRSYFIVCLPTRSFVHAYKPFTRTCIQKPTICKNWVSFFNLDPAGSLLGDRICV